MSDAGVIVLSDSEDSVQCILKEKDLSDDQPCSSSSLVQNESEDREKKTRKVGLAKSKKKRHKLLQLLETRQKLIEKAESLANRQIDFENYDSDEEDAKIKEEKGISEVLIGIERKLFQDGLIDEESIDKYTQAALSGKSVYTVVITETGNELLNVLLTEALAKPRVDPGSISLAPNDLRDVLLEVYRKQLDADVRNKVPDPETEAFDDYMSNVAEVIKRTVREEMYHVQQKLFEDYIPVDELPQVDNPPVIDSLTVVKPYCSLEEAKVKMDLLLKESEAMKEEEEEEEEEERTDLNGDEFDLELDIEDEDDAEHPSEIVSDAVMTAESTSSVAVSSRKVSLGSKNEESVHEDVQFVLENMITVVSNSLNDSPTEPVVSEVVEDSQNKNCNGLSEEVIKKNIEEAIRTMDEDIKNEEVLSLEENQTIAEVQVSPEPPTVEKKAESDDDIEVVYADVREPVDTVNRNQYVNEWLNKNPVEPVDILVVDIDDMEKNELEHGQVILDMIPAKRARLDRIDVKPSGDDDDIIQIE